MSVPAVASAVGSTSADHKRDKLLPASLLGCLPKYSLYVAELRAHTARRQGIDLSLQDSAPPHPE